ncbi:MAG TPA: DinB family protein [Gemmatimonadaceae bacterium]|nr:DinB family protein [Gemmatimonadaceae bacterium]
MDANNDWRNIVASSLDWEQAHAKLDSALANLPPELRGRRPDGLPHSIWELVDHIRRTQHDLLEFCVNKNYHEPKWPDDYWPPSPTPSTDAEWNNALADIHRDTAALAKFTIEPGRDLTAKIPHGTGQTYLRTVLVAVVHSAHHVAQIIDVRRLLKAWPPS